MVGKNASATEPDIAPVAVSVVVIFCALSLPFDAVWVDVAAIEPVSGRVSVNAGDVAGRPPPPVPVNGCVTEVVKPLVIVIAAGTLKLSAVGVGFGVAVAGSGVGGTAVGVRVAVGGADVGVWVGSTAVNVTVGVSAREAVAVTAATNGGSSSTKIPATNEATPIIKSRALVMSRRRFRRVW